jgi:hypothetical protein
VKVVMIHLCRNAFKFKREYRPQPPRTASSTANCAMSAAFRPQRIRPTVQCSGFSPADKLYCLLRVHEAKIDVPCRTLIATRTRKAFSGKILRTGKAASPQDKLNIPRTDHFLRRTPMPDDSKMLLPE